jgi:hypothetical protein
VTQQGGELEVGLEQQRGLEDTAELYGIFDGSIWHGVLHRREQLGSPRYPRATLALLGAEPIQDSDFRRDEGEPVKLVAEIAPGRA